MSYLYRDECDICDNQECFRTCQSKKNNDKELLGFLRSITERPKVKYELDGLGYRGGDVRTVIMDGPAERESIRIVTVSQSEVPSVVTITQNETKTVTVEPKHESTTNERERQGERKSFEKKPRGEGKNLHTKLRQQETSSDDSNFVPPAICIDRNEYESVGPGSKPAKTKKNEGYAGGDVTVTRVVEKTTTLEKPLTLYREVTTTITKEKPITNYKVTTFTDTSTRIESVVVTKTETRVLTADEGSGTSHYQSVASQRSTPSEQLFPDHGVDKTVRVSNDEMNGLMPPSWGGSTVTVTRCDRSMDGHTMTHSGTVTVARCEVDMQPHSKSVDSTAHTVTVTKDASPMMTVTVTKSPGSVTPENIITTTIMASAISVVTINVPMVSTITTSPVPLVTTVTVSSDVSEGSPGTTTKSRIASKAVTKSCEIHPDAEKPRTICRFQNIPKELLKRGLTGRERGRTKKRRTVYRTVYSTEGSADDCERVVTVTKFV